MSVYSIVKPRLAANRLWDVKIFFIIFYAVGIMGLVVPFTFPLFLKLIPFALILSFIFLVAFHRSNADPKTGIVFLSIFVLSLAIEIIGVNTGLIFGVYQYGDSLGFKLFNTPLIIGINWLFLIYTASSVAVKFNIPGLRGMLLASAIILVYDIILEQVAPLLNMWHWSNNVVPVQNYIAWFVIALGFNFLIKVFGIQTQNKLALAILIIQFVFFLSLFIIFKIIR
jgi:putative membrane protein